MTNYNSSNKTLFDKLIFSVYNLGNSRKDMHSSLQNVNVLNVKGNFRLSLAVIGPMLAMDLDLNLWIWICDQKH